jgi:hypothetical protein
MMPTGCATNSRACASAARAAEDGSIPPAQQAAPQETLPQRKRLHAAQRLAMPRHALRPLRRPLPRCHRPRRQRHLTGGDNKPGP